MRVYTFTRADRILKHSDFARIAKNGKRLRNKYFIAVFTANRLKKTRLGITVTKKVGNAAVRNRIKRIVRECFRLEKQKYKKSRDINIIVKKAAAVAKNKQIFSSLRCVFEKIEREFVN